MKPNTITLIIFISAFILGSSAKLISLKNKIKGDFHRSARNVQLSGSVLTATLQDANGAWKDNAQVDLNNYVANLEGKLVWRGSGFAESCNSCTVSDAILSCSCRTSAGQYLNTSLRLSCRLTNNNGNFTVDT